MGVKDKECQCHHPREEAPFYDQAAGSGARFVQEVTVAKWHNGPKAQSACLEGWTRVS